LKKTQVFKKVKFINLLLVSNNKCRFILFLIVCLLLTVFIYGTEYVGFSISPDDSAKVSSYEETGEIEIGIISPENIGKGETVYVSNGKDNMILTLKGWVIAKDPGKVKISAFCMYRNEVLGSTQVKEGKYEKVGIDRNKAYWEMKVYFQRLGEHEIACIAKPVGNKVLPSDIGEKSINFKSVIYGIAFRDFDKARVPKYVFDIIVFGKDGKQIYKKRQMSKTYWIDNSMDRLLTISLPNAFPAGSRVEIINADGTKNEDYVMYYRQNVFHSDFIQSLEWTIPVEAHVKLFLKPAYSSKVFIEFPVYEKLPGFNKFSIYQACDCLGNTRKAVKESFEKVEEMKEHVISYEEIFPCKEIKAALEIETKKDEITSIFADEACLRIGQQVKYYDGFDFEEISDPHEVFVMVLDKDVVNKDMLFNVVTVNRQDLFGRGLREYEAFSPVYRVLSEDYKTVKSGIKAKETKIEYYFNDFPFYGTRIDAIFGLDKNDPEYARRSEEARDLLVSHLCLYKIPDFYKEPGDIQRLESHKDARDDKNILYSATGNVLGDYVILPAKIPPQFLKNDIKVFPYSAAKNNIRKISYSPASYTSKYVRCEVKVAGYKDGLLVEKKETDFIELSFNKQMQSISESDLNCGHCSDGYFSLLGKAVTDGHTTSYSDIVYAPEIELGADYPEGLYSANIVLFDVFGNSTTVKKDILVSAGRTGILSVGDISFEGNSPVMASKFTDKQPLPVIVNVVMADNKSEFKIGYRPSVLRDFGEEEYPYTYINLGKSKIKYQRKHGTKTFRGKVADLNLSDLNTSVAWDFIIKYYDPDGNVTGSEIYYDIGNFVRK